VRRGGSIPPWVYDDREVEMRRGWDLERVLFAMAGSVTLLSALLAWAVSPWFLLLTAFTGASQWMFVLTGNCPASLVLRRVFGLRPAARA